MGVCTVRARYQEISAVVFKNILASAALSLLTLTSPTPALAIGDPQACNSFPPITTGSTLEGSLDAVTDCFFATPGRLTDRFTLTLTEPALLNFTIASDDIGMVVGIRMPETAPGVFGPLVGNRARPDAGSITAQVAVAAGEYVVFVNSSGANPTTPPTGDYSLAISEVAEPQTACDSVGLISTFVMQGSAAMEGNITPADCALGVRDDVVAGDVPRNLDGYAMVLPPNQLAQFTLTADFDHRVEHWMASATLPLAMQGSVGLMPAGSTRHYSFEGDVQATHFIYVVAAAPGGGGSYSVEFNNYLQQQHEALLDLYTSTGGDSWTTKTNWGGEAGTECTWFGITCTDGLVRTLDLSDNNLAGPLPATIGKLNSVENLDLSENAITGSIPESLGYMNDLRYLSLFNNQLSGALPASLAYLDILVSLSLSSNQFSGPIPEYLADKDQLERLYLSGNQFSGAIPAVLADLPALTHLHLQFNRLSGAVPQALLDKGLTELQYNNNPFDLTDPDERAALLALYASTNGDSWTNKSGWGGEATTECTWFGVVCSDGHVRELVLNGNNLVGPLPAALGDLGSLRNLILRNNDLTGSLPETLGQLTLLQNLDLGDNLFTGALPASWAGLDALQGLYLYTNQLSGSIPEWLGDLDTLKFLSLSGNQFIGQIPASLGSLSLLETLHLSGNQLSGTIPASLADLANLQTLHLQFNQLIGTVPAGLLDVTVLNVSNNPFSTEVPAERAALDALYEATNGDNWVNNTGWTNDVPGTLCSRYGVSCISGRVSALNMQTVLNNLARGNGLSGTLPQELGDLTELRNLTLPHNDLSGPLPEFLGTLEQLRQINLSGNLFTGSIPANLGNLTQLQHLQLGGNKLTGSIPETLADLDALQTLTLTSNQLSGSIPAALGAMPSLINLLLQSNQLTGSLPPELGNLSNLVLFNAGVNLLEGAIPASFGALDKLTTLSLSSNHLSGPIPPELADMALLVNLNLGLNDFSGSIPAAFATAPALAGLRVPYNQLEGSIPAELGNSATLKFLQLQNNQFTGTVPAALAQNNQLVTLWVQNNLLTGSFPDELAALPSLIEVDVAGNAFDLPVLGNAEACVNPPVIELGQSLTGSLETAQDCVVDDLRVADNFQLSLAQATSFNSTISSADYVAMTGLRNSDDTKALGKASSVANGATVVLQYALPAGQYRLFSSTYAARPVVPFEGDYALELSAAVAEPQDGCSVQNPTVVVPGSAIAARLQANDCLSNQLGADARVADRYSVELQAGEQVWISVTGDIDLRHTLSTNAFSGWLPISQTEERLEAGQTDAVLFEALSSGPHTFAVMPATLGDTGNYSLYFATHAPLPDAQRNALFTLYNSTNGDGWTDNAGWLGHPGTECTWAGITCTNGVVTGIDLSDNLLTGMIPAALGELSGLLSLNLADNNLAGVVPDVFSNTVVINVENNPLDFTLPEQIVSRGDNGVFYLKSGNMFSFYYDVSDEEDALTGLGLSVHFDSSVLASARFANVLSTSLVGYDTVPGMDTGNADNIGSTDRLLNIAWADVSSQWPGTLPVKLFDLEVKAQDSATTSTPVRIGFARTANASQYRLTLPSVTLTPVRETLDVDGDGTVQALSDALMVVRDMFGFTGDALIAQAISAGSVNNTLGSITTRLEQLDPALDVDRNGSVDALTDGLLILRYTFGFRGDVLVNDALGEGATRTTAVQIEAYLAGFTQL